MLISGTSKMVCQSNICDAGIVAVLSAGAIGNQSGDSGLPLRCLICRQNVKRNLFPVYSALLGDAEGGPSISPFSFFY